jgi:nitrate reductase alpha subunit
MVGAGVGVGATALGLGLCHLRRRADAPDVPLIPPSVTTTPVEILRYGDFTDLYRERWTWDRVAKGTHTRANCIAACSWDVFVKDGIAWREEQNAIYEPPRPDVPDGNPRGCQKGACYTDLQVASSRVLHPLKRVGPRGSGKWQRISWDQALDEVADKLIDAAIDQGTESIIYDHGTTNAGYGPETAGEIRFAKSVGATVLDSWSGVGDMPMGAVQTWGMYNCEGTADDWFRSDYIIVWVGNPAYTRIPEVHFMHEARYRGAKLVVIAPDYNATTVHADLWINLKPETDAALGLAAAQVMVSPTRRWAWRRRRSWCPRGSTTRTTCANRPTCRCWCAKTTAASSGNPTSGNAATRAGSTSGTRRPGDPRWLRAVPATDTGAVRWRWRG